MRHRRSPKGNCSIQGCRETAEWSGLCRACYQALYRLKSKSVGEIAYYMYRVDRFRTRALTLATRRRKSA